MIQVGNTGLFFECDRKGDFDIYFTKGEVFDKDMHYHGTNVDCSGEIFKCILGNAPFKMKFDKDNCSYRISGKRFLKNHEWLIKQAIKEEFDKMSYWRMIKGCLECGVDSEGGKNIYVDEEDGTEQVCCPPMGIESEWELIESGAAVKHNILGKERGCVFSKDNPIVYLIDFDLRSEYVYGLHMICKIKSIKMPVVKNGMYSQKCIFYDDNTSKTISAKLDNRIAEFDKWNKGDKVELYGVFKNDLLLVSSMDLIEEKESEVIITNRNDETPGYNDWRKSIIDRDKKCVCCGLDKHLEAHHLFGYKENPSLAVNESNGVTLCKFCHDKYHSVYGLKNINPVDFMNFIKKYGVR